MVRMILPIERIERLGDSNNENVLAWLDGYLSFDHGNGFATGLGIEAAAKYVASDDPVHNIAAMVEISLEEPPMSEALILLDPTTAAPDGEMQTAFSSNWTEDLPSFGTFWEFMKKGRDALARFEEDYC